MQQKISSTSEELLLKLILIVIFPVSKYDPSALLDDVTPPKRVIRHRLPVNRNMRDRQPAGRRRPGNKS